MPRIVCARLKGPAILTADSENVFQSKHHFKKQVDEGGMGKVHALKKLLL
jgi:hypothetical protein